MFRSYTSKNVFKRPGLLILLSASASLIGGRWGAYIALPGTSIYVIDLLFYGGILFSFKYLSLVSGKEIFLIFGTSFYIFLELLQHSNIAVVLKLRDLAPFIYLLFVPFIRVALSQLELKLIVQCIRASTLLHACWAGLIALHLISPLQMDSVSQIPIFYPRWDHTGIVMAIGLIFWSAFPSAGIRENSLIQIALLSVTVLQWSRASIFAVTCASIFVLWRNHKIFKGVHRKKSKLVTRVLIVILLLTIAFPLLQGYLPEYNVLSRLGIVHSANDALAGADHTKNARIRCQAALMNWVIEEDKLLFGSGAGSEMLIESGAYQFLSGSELVRSPHSWFYGGLARFGIFGFASWIMILTINLAKRPRGEFYLIGLSCVVLICFISLFGVIVESPFGSLPLAFFLAFSGYRKTQFSQDS